MNGIAFYRDDILPFELKCSDTGSDLSYKKHAHEEYSLGIVNDGRSSFWCGGSNNQIGPQSLVFIPGEVVHACNPQKEGPWKYKMLYLQAKWMRDFFTAHGKAETSVSLIKTLKERKRLDTVNRLLNRLAGPADRLEKESALLALLEESFAQATPVLAKRRIKPQLKCIREYLQKNFCDRISLDQLEEVSGLNKFYIIRAFKEEFSIPPHAYQTLLRINHAKKELRKGRAISDVAYGVGFYDQSHFHKTFKQQMGLTPEHYQQADLRS